MPDRCVAAETFVSGGAAAELATPPDPGPFPVRFDRSGVETTWTAASCTLLEPAEAAGLVPPAHRRAWICGTCRVSVIDGAGADLCAGFTGAPEPGLLVCCSVSTGPLVLDV